MSVFGEIILWSAFAVFCAMQFWWQYIHFRRLREWIDAQVPPPPPELPEPTEEWLRLKGWIHNGLMTNMHTGERFWQIQNGNIIIRAYHPIEKTAKKIAIKKVIEHEYNDPRPH